MDGYIINPYTHRRELCPECAEKRHKMVKTGEVKEELKLPPSLTGGNFIPDAVIPSSERSALEADSVDEIIEKAKSVISDLLIGVLPDESLLFNFGRKAYDANFIAPLLTKAYEGGLSAVPLLTPVDIIQSRHYLDSGDTQERKDIISYNDIRNKQVCVVCIDAGATNEEILAVKGVMQLRAMYNLPTIMVTHVWNYNIGCLYNEGGTKSYSIATLYQVRYKNKKNYQTMRGSTGRMSESMFMEAKSLGV